MFIGLGCCPPTGHNLGFYWHHYWTPWEDIST
jgi:hypothetical protein